ncbi:gene transfer agent family protein [Phaeobacter sp. NW0010-22]|uniref:gene transfer agent family protein n=1 Tax=Phaeobacter sp. NW0010-22 TaxID=3135907 RepID=UPI00310C7029
MVEVVAEWAGTDRLFQLVFGGVLDLEEATGDGIGSIFIQVTGGQFKAKHVFHTIRLGLIGGGMSILDTKRLMDTHFDTRPYMENAALAGRILADLMVGVEDTKASEGDVDQGALEPHKFSEVSQICRVFNLSPLDLRKLRYADFVNMVRGFNAASDKKAPHLSEDEFIDILNRYEPEVTQ